MDNHEIDQLKKKLNNIVRRNLFNGKRIVLFGASPASKEVKNCLKEHGLHPSAVIDNDIRKIGKESLGLTVQKPEDLLLPADDSIVVLLWSVGYFHEMMLQLEGLGYHENKQVFCLNFKTNESIPVVVYKLARIIRGFWWHKRLTAKYTNQHTLFVAPYTGTGDIYLVGLFFQEYLKRNNITQYTFIVVSSACRKVAEMFDIKSIEIISRVAVDDMINCNRALHADWPLVVLNDCWAAEYTNTLQWIRGFKDLSFDKMFRYFVFGFDDTVAIQLPPCKNYSDDVKILFEKYGLAEGKTVVFSPYSNTLFELQDAVWNEIAAYCKSKGYSVCTNCAGPGEKAIEGTVPVFFPLGQAVEFMDRAGFFIGARSGLCDIISTSSCKKIILYEKDGFFYKCSPYEYFSLKKMGLCEDAVEFDYRPDLNQELLDLIYGQI